MTEKWIVDDCGTLINMETRENYDYMEEVVDVLNKLSKENEQLKQSFDKSLLNHTKTCDEYRILSKKNKRLTEENEELKQEIEEHKAVINREWNKYLKKHEMI